MARALQLTCQRGVIRAGNNIGFILFRQERRDYSSIFSSNS